MGTIKNMKKYLFLFLLLLLFIGCTPVLTSVYAPNVNNEKTTIISDVFFTHTEGIGYGGTDPYVDNAFRFDLTIVEFNDQKIGLLYNEYTRIKEPTGNPYIPTRNSDWLIKQGFTKRFDYAFADKLIRFKEYEFEVISVDKGQIIYRRTK